MTIDKEAGAITFTGSKATWKNGSPEEVGYFEKNRDLVHLKEHIIPEISAHSVRSAALK